ncbi:VOC family protein [Micromonospora sp. NPDC047670]|uniref:VOC family protein n=1 Tax=Micromonospora sp. NPDC047670 TaxID=3364252 RepID=UPI003723AA82
MLRPASAFTSVLLALTLVTGCSEPSEDGRGQAGASATSAAPSAGGGLDGQDKISDSWPREIPLPAKYEVKSASSPDGKYHALNVFAVSTEDVRATLDQFTSNGFKTVRETETGKGGLYEFANDKWNVSLIIGVSDANGNPTNEDTGLHFLGYNVGPVS